MLDDRAYDGWLDQADQDALEMACAGASEYLCAYRVLHRKTGQPVGGDLLFAVEEIVARHVNEALDKVGATR